MKVLKKLDSYIEPGSPGVIHILTTGKYPIWIEVYEYAPGQYTLEWDDRRFCKSVGILKEYFRMEFDYLQDAVVAASRLYYAIMNAPDEEWWYNHCMGYNYYSVGGPCPHVDTRFGDWSRHCVNPLKLKFQN